MNVQSSNTTAIDKRRSLLRKCVPRKNTKPITMAKAWKQIRSMQTPGVVRVISDSGTSHCTLATNLKCTRTCFFLRSFRLDSAGPWVIQAGPGWGGVGWYSSNGRRTLPFFITYTVYQHIHFTLYYYSCVFLHIAINGLASYTSLAISRRCVLLTRSLKKKCP